MIFFKKVRVKEVKRSEAGFQEVLVEFEGRQEKALSYPSLTGRLEEGDEVIINTTAGELDLGSGGYHFVLWNLKRRSLVIGGEGHIMKLRYTPLQSAFLSVEEEKSPYHEIIKDKDQIPDFPVFIGSLHSQLPSVVATFKHYFPNKKLAYIMTDGGALPAYLSYSVNYFRRLGLLDFTITSGQAFGGDYEAVNVASALVAACYALRADAAVVLMGPGIAGTATRLGFSGLEQGEIANLVYALKGKPFLLPRLQFSDPRKRHYGFSHHFLTILKRILLFRPLLILPEIEKRKKTYLLKQLKTENIERNVEVKFVQAPDLEELFSSLPFIPTTMGRTFREEPYFFLAAAAPVLFFARESLTRRKNEV